MFLMGEVPLYAPQKPFEVLNLSKVEARSPSKVKGHRNNHLTPTNTHEPSSTLEPF